MSHVVRVPVATNAAKGVDTVTQLVVATDAEAGSARTDLPAQPRVVSYPEFAARETGDALPWSVADELAPISINYTSGTTGRPKGVTARFPFASLSRTGLTCRQASAPRCRPATRRQVG